MVEDAQIFDPKATTLADQFVCGYVDQETKEVYRDFVVSELTGEEEDLIAGQGPAVPRMNKMIHNLLISVGPITDKKKLADVVWKMPASDRMLALIAIRKCTRGNVYNMLVPMPKDSAVEKKRYKVNLATLQRNYMKEPEKRQREDVITVYPPTYYELPEEERKGIEGVDYTVRWHIMEGNDETWRNKVNERTKNESRATMEILCRLDGIDDYEVKRGRVDDDSRMLSEQLKKSLKFVKGIPARIRSEIRQLFNDHEGNIDTELEFVYEDKEGNQKSFQSELNVGQKSFFFPQETSDN